MVFSFYLFILFLIPARRWLFLCIFCGKSIYILSFLSFLVCSPMDLLEVASFVVLHGCGAYTPYLAFLHCE
jgi:hypothetical protein